MTSSMITPLPIFNDNYIWIIEDLDKMSAICIDPGLAEPVIKYLTHKKLTLEAILITHHHADHIGGLSQLKTAYPQCEIITPVEPRVKNSTRQVSQVTNIVFKTNELNFEVIETPGHTTTHICYFSHLNNTPILFCGDTLFSGGCGRLFEGTAQDMLNSLQKLSKLPNETQIYCAHEYTRSNLAFYQSISKSNVHLNDYYQFLSSQNHLISLPSTLEREKKINPFLRCHTDELKTRFVTELESIDELTIFTHLRKLKDTY